MTNEPENTMLELFHAIRSEHGEAQKRDREMLSRLASIESLLAVMHGDSVRMTARGDDHEERLHRIEARLGLLDA